MTAKPKPEHSPKPTSPDAESAELSPAEEEARLERLVARGLMGRPEEPGGMTDDLLDEPGPWCPGAVEALIEDRRAGR